VRPSLARSRPSVIYCPTYIFFFWKIKMWANHDIN
jgi:hypothetical protein